MKPLKNIYEGRYRISEPCNCMEKESGTGKLKLRNLHIDQQDTKCSAWKKLNDYIQIAIEKNLEEFDPASAMSLEEWQQIVALPPSIANLKYVKKLLLYGSNLSRIPPEIGEMKSLEEFEPYTSYRLHWFPYEITRCKNLKKSTISTRALYGNIKNSAPFPKLPVNASEIIPEHCSVCKQPLSNKKNVQKWISLRVATDYVPLLVNACSNNCIKALPTPPDYYLVPYPHDGGKGIELTKFIWT